MLLGALFPVTSARFDMRYTICAAAPNKPHQPNVTKPQCNGAANSSSTNQNAWPHSFKPTFGRMNIGSTTTIGGQIWGGNALMAIHAVCEQWLKERTGIEWSGPGQLIRSDQAMVQSVAYHNTQNKI